VALLLNCMYTCRGVNTSTKNVCRSCKMGLCWIAWDATTFVGLPLVCPVCVRSAVGTSTTHNAVGGSGHSRHTALMYSAAWVYVENVYLPCMHELIPKSHLRTRSFLTKVSSIQMLLLASASGVGISKEYMATSTDAFPFPANPPHVMSRHPAHKHSSVHIQMNHDNTTIR